MKILRTVGPPILVSKEQGRSTEMVGVGKVIGIAIAFLFVGMILGGYLSFTVVAPELQKLHIDFGVLGSNNNNQSNQNNNNNNNNNNNDNNNPTNNNPNNNSNNNNDPNGNNQNTSNPNNNNNQNQPAINNNNQPPSNETASYGGSGQFKVSMQSDGTSYSGTLTANINIPVQQVGNNIQFSLDLSPTSVSGSLQQAIQTGGSDTIFNFDGTVSNSQVTANAQGTTGNGQTFDLNISGSINSNTFSFTVTSAGDSQLTVSTPQQIVTHNN
jgi:hypothetical protein